MRFARSVPPGGTTVVRLRLSDAALDAPLTAIDRTVRERLADADEFYASIHPKGATEDEKRVQRQAFAGLMWSKQNYIFDVAQWLEGDHKSAPPPPQREYIRNTHWKHLNSMRVLSMPDKWEYPWF